MMYYMDTEQCLHEPAGERQKWRHASAQYTYTPSTYMYRSSVYKALEDGTDDYVMHLLVGPCQSFFQFN